MPHETFLEIAQREFRGMRRQAEKALAQLPEDAYFSTLDAEANSPALLVKHIAGNLRSRWTDFLTDDGEKPWRDRDGEFEIRPGDTRASLEAAWAEGWESLARTMDALADADPDRDVTIRGESFTVAQAIARSLTHIAGHVGQIVLLSKHLSGSKWKSLSIPRGQSEQFNQAPGRYLGKAKPS